MTNHVIAVAVLLAVPALVGLHPARTDVSPPHTAASASGRLTAIGTMRVPRAAHSSTTLDDGRVLVAGGFVEKGSAHGAELYDSTTGRFVPLPAMVTTRHSHTATTLDDGRVLIVGGYGFGHTTLADAEIFDPRTGRFTATGPMHDARADHVAVALTDGRVLVAGGLGTDWTFLASAEVYDPARGRFVRTGSLAVAREGHAATRLADGSVLVVGGHVGRRDQLRLHASAERYDPETGRFAHAGDMLVARHKHDVVTLDERRALVVGGSDRRDGDGAFDTTEIFDVPSGRFSRGPRMHRARYKLEGAIVRLTGGRLLVGGGARDAEILDPATMTFTLVNGESSMAGQFAAVSALHDGRALITGGYGGGTGPRATAWEYR